MANAANPATPVPGDSPTNDGVSAPPTLWGIVPRIVLITFGITGISFAVSLFVGIVAMAMMGAFKGHFPDMRMAYRMFALPIAMMVGTLALLIASVVEIRDYFRSKRLIRKGLESGR